MLINTLNTLIPSTDQLVRLPLPPLSLPALPASTVRSSGSVGQWVQVGLVGWWLGGFIFVLLF